MNHITVILQRFQMLKQIVHIVITGLYGAVNITLSARWWTYYIYKID
jgi:hypothetical protein